MTTAIAATAARTIPTTQSSPPWLMRAIDGLVKDGLRVTIPSRLALTDEQQRAVAQRIVACEMSMQAAPEPEISREVAGLLLAFPSAKLSDTAAMVRARAYHTALEGIPLWALCEAARKWLRGEGDGNNLDFAPTAPRLRRMAEAETLAVRQHLVELRQLRDAKVERIVRDEERAAKAQNMAHGAVKRMGG